MMKLSSIAYPHGDRNSEKLYQPLRGAIQNLSQDKTDKVQSRISQNQLFTSFVKQSHAKKIEIEPQRIKQSTLVPQNMHLIQTNNPIKRIKARSKSYRPISVDEVMKKPISDRDFKQSIRMNPGRKKQIIYDYQPNSYQSAQIIGHPQIGNTRGQLQGRSRSLPFINPVVINYESKVEKVNPQKMEIIRKNPQSQGSNTSIHLEEQIRRSEQLQRIRQSKNSKKSKETIPDFSSDYYQNCNKYNFNRNFKQQKRSHPSNRLIKEVSPGIRPVSRSNSNYKYNLFSLMDQQTNQRCTTGFCTKNQIVASKIRKKW